MKHSIILFIIILFIGCTKESPIEPTVERHAVFEIVKLDTVRYDSDSYSPYGGYIVITTKNTGNAAAYNVRCHVKLFRLGILIDSSTAIFNQGAIFYTNEISKSTAYFYHHYTWDQEEYQFDWIDKKI